MKIKIVFILSFIMLLACNDEEESYEVVEKAQVFQIVDSNGQDLLNPEREDKIDYDKIRLYYLVNNEKTDAYEYWKKRLPHALFGYSFALDVYTVEKEDKNKYVLSVILSDEVVHDDMAYTFIEWNQHGWDIDTIQSQVSHRGSIYESLMVMFNDSVWNRPNNPVPPNEWTLLDQSFTIIK